MVKCAVSHLHVRYGQVPALHDLTLDVQEHEILTIIGPANSGKTTFLRALNRMNELLPHVHMTGSVTLDGQDLYRLDAEAVRRRVGMVFAMPSPLPLSIFDNVAYGVRMHGRTRRGDLPGVVTRALQQAYLWDEVKDRLQASAFTLSGGQQQRLCVARTLAMQPELILFDEPCSGLDPISTARVEAAMVKLKESYTIVLVTNNVKQAARVGTRTAFFLMGQLIEIGPTDQMFTAPADQRTEDYIEGKFG